MASTINADTTNGVVVTSDTSGEIELQSAGVTKAKVTANGLQDANGNSLRGGMYRNLIINGNMQIAQRSTSVASISSGSTYNTIDRFKTVLSSAGTWTQTQSTDVPTGQGFASSLKMDCTTANASLASGAYNSIQHYIEGQNLQQLAYGTSNAKSLTVSFWVKSNKTGTYVVQFLQNDSNRTIVKSYTISSANTWEYKTITIDGDTAGTINNDNGIGLEVRFGLAFGSDFTSGTLQTTWGALTLSNFAVGQVNLADSTANYINITGVQLEVGEGASDFEFLPHDVQLQRCQRYYEQSYPYGTVAGAANAGKGAKYVCVGLTRPNGYGIETVFYTVEKRAAATVIIYAYNGTAGSISNGDSGATIATANAIQNSTKGFLPRQTGGTTLAAQTYIYHYSASSEL